MCHILNNKYNYALSAFFFFNQVDHKLTCGNKKKLENYFFSKRWNLKKEKKKKLNNHPSQSKLTSVQSCQMELEELYYDTYQDRIQLFFLIWDAYQFKVLINRFLELSSTNFSRNLLSRISKIRIYLLKGQQ